MRKPVTSFLLLLLFLVSLIYKDEVIAGAAEGLLLWYRFALPSLLPFMILVNVMLHADALPMLAKLSGPLMKRFPGVSAEGSFAVIAGFLCGYPMGAKVSADLVKSEKISHTEGAYLLSFCNNASPMFILGVLLTQFVPERKLHLPFFLILLFSPLLCGQLFRIYYTRKAPGPCPSCGLPCGNPAPRRRESFPQMLDLCLMDSFHAIVKVGLYMMLFSIAIQLGERLFAGAGLARALCLSSLEITSGLALLARLPIPARLKYVLLLAQTSFGGLCAAFQTASMVQDAGLRILPYIAEKLITAIVTSLLACLLLFA